MLNIVCVNAGNYEGRGAQYVNTLFDMVARNLAEGLSGRFVCFTDDPTGLDPHINTRELPPGLKGWWNKLYLFKRGVFEEGERVLYFDLDTLITGRLDEIAAYDGEFAILEDFYRGGTGDKAWGSGVMAWRGGFGAHFWDEFEEAGRHLFPDIFSSYCPDVFVGGDQAWIEKHQDKADTFQDLFPDLFVSYKVSGGEIPKKASVVGFHGHPRPHEVLTGWVPQVWKIGGITRAELDVVCNTENETIHAHIVDACKRDLPWLKTAPDHDCHVCIVGGGPWLPDALPEIQAMRGFGHEIWALNNTHDWLIEHGIVPDACVLLDAREDNARFVANAHDEVTYYVASQCHPSVFEALSGKRVVVYHNATDGAQVLLESISQEPTIHLLGGGTTVGMKALILARLMGFKRFHLYGMDSCYRDGAGHAYPQPVNDADLVIDVICEGKSFKCAPWMVAQANDFQDTVRQLVEQDCIITVAGQGLLANLVNLMSADLTPDSEIVEIDGLWWPSKDRVARPSALVTSGDIAHMIGACDGRDVVVQAGGNCGVWPRLLGRHFKTVYTFEPDWLNFQCLVRNASDSNIIKMQAALGFEHEMVDLERKADNCGAHQVIAGGFIPVLRIDDLKLSACDLIQLDIEGYELNALRGAEQTIRTYHPVIAIEDNGLSKRYGTSAGAVEVWLAQFGYTVHKRVNRDVIFTHMIQPKEAVNA